MTHQPPIPEAATSPYPLHPDPIPEEQKAAAAAAAKQDAEASAGRGISGAVIGIGAAIGLGAATVTGLLYAGRSSARRASSQSKQSGDDKRKRGAADRSRVSVSEPYELRYFARKHGITAQEARAIIKEAGPSRAAANALAKKRKNG